MAGVCTWMASFTGLPVTAEDIARLLGLGLGHPVSVGDLQQAARRMRHVERAFSAALDLDRRNDRLSPAYFARVKQDDAARRAIGFDAEELERMKDDYYRLREWDEQTGLPARETLVRCGLTDVADRLADLKREALRDRRDGPPPV